MKYMQTILKMNLAFFCVIPELFCKKVVVTA